MVLNHCVSISVRMNERSFMFTKYTNSFFLFNIIANWEEYKYNLIVVCLIFGLLFVLSLMAEGKTYFLKKKEVKIEAEKEKKDEKDKQESEKEIGESKKSFNKKVSALRLIQLC
jgi:hypothetical protein